MRTLRTMPGAIGLAVLLALVTLPLTVAGLDGIESIADTDGRYTRPALGVLGAATLFAVLCAAVVGGLAARAVPATSSTGRLVTAVLVSWPVAIIALPVVPALLGAPADIGAAYVGDQSMPITSSDPASGFHAYLLSFLSLLFIFPAFLAFGAATLALKWLAGSRRALPGAGVLLAALGATLAAAGGLSMLWRWPLPVVLAAGAALWAPVVWLGWRRRALRPATLLAFGATLAAVNGMSIFEAPVPFLVLVAGAAVWTLALRRAEGVPGALAPHQRARPNDT